MIRPLAPFTATLNDMAQLVGASLHGADAHLYRHYTC